jgi:hypothetical protein
MLCFKGHIPTGSPVSSYLAFFSHYNCFYEIHTLSRAHGEDMTLYVDDMTFSSKKKPSKWFILTVGKILSRYGLSCNIEKTTIYMPDENEKILTGVCVNSSGKMFPTSNQLQKIYEEMAIPEIERNPHRLRGMIAHKDRILNYKQKHSTNAPHSVKLRG